MLHHLGIAVRSICEGDYRKDSRPTTSSYEDINLFVLGESLVESLS